MVEFRALGGVRVSDGGRDLNVGGPQQRRLLAMLLVHRNAVVSVDRLIDTVFAGEPSPAAATTLRSYIARMRRVVDANGSPPMVVTEAPGYVLKVADDAFDVARFEARVGEGRTLLSGEDPAGAASALREALALWHGDAYAEFDDEHLALAEAQRLRSCGWWPRSCCSKPSSRAAGRARSSRTSRRSPESTRFARAFRRS